MNESAKAIEVAILAQSQLSNSAVLNIHIHETFVCIIVIGGKGPVCLTKHVPHFK